VQPIQWQFWALFLTLLAIAVLLWLIWARIPHRNPIPYRSRTDLETAYQNGAISWEEYDRWRQRVK